MNSSFFIAKRYFFSQERKSFINITAFFSLFIVACCTAAMIVVLSVFNGFSRELREIHKSFDPDIAIVPAKGKSFKRDTLLIKQIKGINGIEAVTEVIEDDAYLEYNNRHRLARFKGVDANFYLQNNINRSLIFNEEPILEDTSSYYCIPGLGIANDMELTHNPLKILYPKRKKIIRNHNSLNYVFTNVKDIFQIEKLYDDRFIFIPIRLAEKLTDNEGARTSIEVKVKEGYAPEKVTDQLESILDATYKVLSGDRQHAALYKATELEKLIAFMVLFIILIMASINLYIVNTMMIVSKKKDIFVLHAIGATWRQIKSIFFMESILIGVVGTMAGVILGVGLCLLQQYYGLLRIQTESSLLSSYPVALKLTDILLATVSSLLITTFIAINPIKKINTNFIKR